MHEKILWVGWLYHWQLLKALWAKNRKSFTKLLNYLLREIIGTPSLETSKMMVEKIQDADCGKVSTSGGDLLMSGLFLRQSLWLLLLLPYTDFFNEVSILLKLKMPVSRHTATECHSSALHDVCLLGLGRLPAPSDILLPLLQITELIERCISVPIESEFTSYILFIQKAKKISPKYVLPFGAICQMDTETQEVWNHLVLWRV